MSAPSLKLLKILFICFIITLPLTNRDIFGMFGFDYFLPVRIIDVIFGLFGAYLVVKNIYLLGARSFFEKLKSYKEDKFLILLISLWFVRVLSILNSRNLTASLNLLSFYSFMIIVYLFMKYLFTKNVSLGFSLYKTYLTVLGVVALYGLLQVLLFFTTGVSLPGLLMGGNYFRVPAT